MRAREEIQKRKAISERNRRIAGLGSAAALTGLAMWGQDMMSMLGDLTGLPIEEVDFAVYFMACFLVVHTVLPKSYRA
ncbi:hypothetical protein HYH03_010833 [Edaphochlamys debaryana]|uniref:Uncharacterized protein n=1 Tax=Edaphochlamys debaryana TaxID=47281 RepID=A0A835XW46_9CHLO|nr:hypothetical protein HYH03_010833 [Edaphochlamys debaryana]|eukprot:KAG2490920.1 hypothetical protein HYH03_010833 [Edaphochlamys debaryana]